MLSGSPLGASEQSPCQPDDIKPEFGSSRSQSRHHHQSLQTSDRPTLRGEILQATMQASLFLVRGGVASPPLFFPFPTMTIRMICVSSTKGSMRPSALEWCRCVTVWESTRKGRAVLSPLFPWLTPRCHLVQSEWCVVPTPALYASKRQGETEKLRCHRPFPSKTKSSLSRQSKKKNTIHGCLGG